VSQHKLQPSEITFLQKAMNADSRNADVRLREGEYPYELAKTIVSFQLDLHFPDVKQIIKKLYGEEKANDVQFVRKIQTILKRMEKSDIVTILPKRKPWELQRYMLPSFKFVDANKNSLSFATNEQIKQAQNLLDSLLVQHEASVAKVRNSKIKIGLLTSMVFVSYAVILWNFIQPIVNPIIFILAFSVSVMFALMLGRTLSR
jgi:hypothetical protein